MSERLEEIKSRVWKDKGTYAMGDYSQREGYIYTLSDYDYEWLIEQVERVQDLKIMLKVLGERNQRFKKALEFYADKETYEQVLISEAQQIDGNWIEPAQYEPPTIYFDKGETARKALEGTKNE